VEVVQRFTALVEIGAPLGSQIELARGPLKQRDAQLFLQSGYPTAHRVDRHTERTGCAAEAFKLRDLYEYGDVIQVNHRMIFS
jgi:hypothetical protein